MHKALLPHGTAYGNVRLATSGREQGRMKGEDMENTPWQLKESVPNGVFDANGYRVLDCWSITGSELEGKNRAAFIVQAVNIFDLLVAVRDKAEGALDFMVQGQPETYQLAGAIAELDAIWPEGSTRGKVQAKLAKGE